MHTPKVRSILIMCLIAANLLGLVWLPATGARVALAAPLPTGPSDTQPITDKELVRNGGFDHDKTAWATNPIGTHVGDGYGQGDVGMGMQIWPEFSNNVGFIYQEIYPPTQTTAATLSFDYRFVENTGAGFGYFQARVVTDTGTIATLLYVDLAGYPGQIWQAPSASLSAGELAVLNAAHTAGQRVYVMIDLYAQFLYANVDNVSFQVSGSMDYPDLGGSIGYVGLDSSGYAKTVNRIDPDGGNAQTLWTHPSAIPATNHIYDVAWKPDGSELAFSSNHEVAYSAFHSDVYGIQPDGSGLRRITNPPSKAEIDAGSYQFGTVTGSIYNNYGSVTIFQLYVEGAQEPVSVSVGNQGDTVSFPALTVADLGTGLHYVVFTWSDGGSVCKEYAAAAIDVQAGQTTNANLTFSGTCGTYDSRSISWKRDGTQIGVDVITPHVFLATGQAFGTELFSAPLTADELAWSPVNDQLLYRNWILSGDSGIYLSTVGGGTGTWLVDDGGALYVTPAWLPDGSGFVYTLDNTLYQYNLSDSQVTTLAVFYSEFVANPSPSPTDGNYIVFERQTIQAPLQYDLWIVNRTNPVEMWALTEDGRSRDPDWSRQTPPSPSCPVALSSVSISGPTVGFTNTTHTFTAAHTPFNASPPINYTWSGAPTSGQGTSSASYVWPTTGSKTITVTAENCGGVRRDTHTITITAAQRVYLPLVLRK
jgi:hypothetical protein